MIQAMNNDNSEGIHDITMREETKRKICTRIIRRNIRRNRSSKIDEQGRGL